MHATSVSTIIMYLESRRNSVTKVQIPVSKILKKLNVEFMLYENSVQNTHILNCFYLVISFKNIF